MLEAEANASLGENGTGFVERVTGFSVIDLVAEVRRLREIVAQQAAPAVPAGWKLVPVEPTDDQLVAGQEEWVRGRRGALEDCMEANAIYAAMLAAAPEYTAPEGKSHE